jgi:hypothetical protein
VFVPLTFCGEILYTVAIKNAIDVTLTLSTVFSTQSMIFLFRKI